MSRIFHHVQKDFTLYMLALISFLIPWFVVTGATDSINTTKLILLATGVGVLLIGSLLTFAFQESHTIIHSIFDWLFLLLGVSALLSAIASLDPSRSFWGIHDEGTLSLTLIVILALFSWYIIQRVSTAKAWWMIIYALLAGVFVLAVLMRIPQLGVYGVSGTQIGTGMFFAVVAAFSAGLALSASRANWQVIALYCAALLSAISIYHTNVFLPRIFLTIGFGCMAAFGIFYAKAAVKGRSLFTIALFAVSLIMVFFPHWKLPTPARQPDILLGSESSWNIVATSFRDTPKQTLLGNGPGTFLHMFNAYRSPSFNNDPVTAAMRFAWPHNSLIALLSEFGLFFTIIFFLFVFVFFGILSTSWRKQQTLLAALKKSPLRSHKALTALDVFVCSASLLLATAGLVFFYAEYAYWALWWLLFSLTVVASSGFIPSLFHAKEHKLRVPEQYRLVSIFGVLLLVAAVVVAEVFVFRAYLADRAYASSFGLSQELAEDELLYARSLHPANERYAIALAYNRVRQAQERINAEDEASDEDLEYAITALQDSVNMLRAQTELQPNNAFLWQTLAELYGITRTFTPDAVKWEISSIEQAIVHDPINALLYVKLGVAYEVAENIREAERAYKEALVLQPSLHRARVRLALLYEADEQYDKAIALFAPIISGLQNEPDLLAFVGRLYYNRAAEGDLPIAEELWLAALRRSPQLVDAHYALQVLYERTGNRQQAQKHKTALEQLQ